jgi:4-amino-4-deoxy-L-arabinose transferase-like glycosyltransferase
MNINDKRQQVVLGAFLIGLGLVWWLNLWWLLVPAAVGAAGVAAYVQRRAMGRVVEAVQGGLWGLGLALLLLLGFVWPGLLFLAGASILARGREHELDGRVQLLLGWVRRPNSAIQPVRSQQVPITTHSQPSETVDSPAVGETTRLP